MLHRSDEFSIFFVSGLAIRAAIDYLTIVDRPHGLRGLAVTPVIGLQAPMVCHGTSDNNLSLAKGGLSPAAKSGEYND